MGSALSFRRFGAIEAAAVSDGVLNATYDPFRGLPREDCIRLVGRPDTGPGSVSIPVSAFVVRLGDKLMLVDAGTGTSFGPTLGHLPENLRAGGIDPSAVTHVLLTHIHPDHSNGLVDADNNPVFPNAEVLVHGADARFWLDREPEAGDSDFVKRNLAAARRVLGRYVGRLHRVDDGEAMPGVFARLSAGHTPGHTTWLLAAGNGSLLFWGDTVHVGAVQFPHPDVTMIYDLDQPAAAAARRRVFDWVAADRIAVAGAHLGGSGFGYVTRRGSGYGCDAI